MGASSHAFMTLSSALPPNATKSRPHSLGFGGAPRYTRVVMHCPEPVKTCIRRSILRVQTQKADVCTAFATHSKPAASTMSSARSYHCNHVTSKGAIKRSELERTSSSEWSRRTRMAMVSGWAGSMRPPMRRVPGADMLQDFVSGSSPSNTTCAPCLAPVTNAIQVLVGKHDVKMRLR